MITARQLEVAPKPTGLRAAGDTIPRSEWKRTVFGLHRQPRPVSLAGSPIKRSASSFMPVNLKSPPAGESSTGSP